jgi:prophage tail gpP-like protein
MADPLPQEVTGTPGASGQDLATLEINGQLYRDWETIQVHLTQEEVPYRTFRFTCSEGFPLSKNFASLRIRPGDKCQVMLANEPVVYGFVSTRQVYYDAQRHHIEIQGSSAEAGLANTSVISKTMEHKNVNYEQYARALLKPFIPQINFIVRGGQLPQFKFPRISIAHGTSIIEALEIPLRSLGGIALSSTFKGDVVAHVGNSVDGSDTVVEGKNILEGREMIYNQSMAKDGAGLGQNWGTDAKHGPVVSHVPFARKAIAALPGQYRPNVLPMDLPAYDDSHLKGRVQMEHDTMEQDQVTLFITVHGWQRPSGGLWKQRQEVKVISPMLIMDGSEQLFARSVTFSQDNQRGTRTVLELVNKKGLNPDAPGGARPETRSDDTSAPSQDGFGSGGEHT